ncbi:indole-3-glycerol-phosphate synthase [Candidatus Poribacteria bacterium]|nr:indole-3-glycerol-phosphate synthase [Candidatus Poribacteria bacterium]
MAPADILTRIVAHKREELAADRASAPLPEVQRRARDASPPRDFANAVRGSGDVRLIAEIKKASPSKGVIQPDFDHRRTAAEYAEAGVDAISVLTDRRFFQGALSYIEDVRQVAPVPVLRKDFTLDAYHVWQARAAGADAILLIVALLTDEELRAFSSLAGELGMACLVETHDAVEMSRACAMQAPVIGINNRDLRTFETSLDTTFALRALAPSDATLVSESGIHDRADVRRLREGGIDAMLVGEALMASASTVAKIHDLRAR